MDVRVRGGCGDGVASADGGGVGADLGFSTALQSTSPLCAGVDPLNPTTLCEAENTGTAQREAAAPDAASKLSARGIPSLPPNFHLVYAAASQIWSWLRHRLSWM